MSKNLDNLNKKNKFITWGLLVLITIVGIIAMLVVTPVDEEWTRFLRENRIDWFKDWMGDSIFEGEMLGGSDLPVMVMIVAGALYLLAWLPLIPNQKIRNKLSFLFNWVEKRPKFHMKLDFWRPSMGFILMSSLVLAIFVHANKWMMGRPRPKYVLEKGMAYSDWYEFGAYFIADGSFRGSFPSGHTATVISLLALVYVLVFNTKKTWVKLIGFVAFILTIGLSVLMLLARSMSNAHWVSDSVMSIIAGWFIIHITYFWILRVPEQQKYFQANQKPMPLPFVYELQYTLILFLIVLGGMALVLGLRAVYIQNCPWLVFICPIGLFVVFFCWRLFKKFGCKLKAADDSQMA